MKKITSEDAISFGKETFVTRSPGSSVTSTKRRKNSAVAHTVMCIE